MSRKKKVFLGLLLVLLLAFGIWRVPKWFKMKAVSTIQYTDKGELFVILYNDSTYIRVDNLCEEYVEKGIFIKSNGLCFGTNLFPYRLTSKDDSEEICVYPERRKILSWLLWCERAYADDVFLYVDSMYAYVREGFVFPDYRKDKIGSVILFSRKDGSKITITDEERIKAFMNNAVSGTDFTEFMSYEERYDKEAAYNIFIDYADVPIEEEIGEFSEGDTIFIGVGHLQAKTEENPDETTTEDETTAEDTAKNLINEIIKRVVNGENLLDIVKEIDGYDIAEKALAYEERKQKELEDEERAKENAKKNSGEQNTETTAENAGEQNTENTAA